MSLVELAGNPRLGTLPDFGNFPPETDRYAAVEALMDREDIAQTFDLLKGSDPA